MTTTTQPKHTNRLIDATSPYLLQHAHNPVNWYPWGSDALEAAKKQNKPIFLSIGYSACHWCHVMERESFENEDIAEFMNAHFICIKVDREERPDIDDIYMTATQALTGSGGWPMSVWLTPELKPFHAGTYFPPEDRHGRPGFKRVLTELARMWREERHRIDQAANALTNALEKYTQASPGDGLIPVEALDVAAQVLARAFDSVEGGISGGGTNKFPPSMAMDVMLRAYHRSLAEAKGDVEPNTRLRDLVELTLRKMAYGGIYDHLGGGFARYSTDKRWLVPHFEKMLYDQALVSDIYLRGYQLTGDALYARTVRETFDYVLRDLQDPKGGFYSARDADSEGVEGKFYVWTKEEIDTILGEEASNLFCDYYNVSASGNWEGHNILNVPRPAETVAAQHDITVEQLREKMAAARGKLFEVREKRVKPHRDDKVLAAWNGLMIASLAKGARILGEDRYRDAAARAADFVLKHMMRDGRLLRTWREGKTHTLGYLDDHAFMIEGLLNLYETTFDTKWLDAAVALNDDVMAHFRDDANGGFFFTADDAEKLIVRTKDANDGAIPSGNSVHCMNLLRLAILLDRQDLAEEAERVLKAFGPTLKKSPLRSERLVAALDFYLRRPQELAFVAASNDADQLDKLINIAWRTYVPNVVFARLLAGAPGADKLAERIPLLEAKTPVDGKPAVYVCRNYTCQAPTTDPEVLRKQLEPVVALAGHPGESPQGP